MGCSEGARRPCFGCALSYANAEFCFADHIPPAVGGGACEHRVSTARWEAETDGGHWEDWLIRHIHPPMPEAPELPADPRPDVVVPFPAPTPVLPPAAIAVASAFPSPSVAALDAARSSWPRGARPSAMEARGAGRDERPETVFAEYPTPLPVPAPSLQAAAGGPRRR